MFVGLDQTARVLAIWRSNKLNSSIEHINLAIDIQRPIRYRRIDAKEVPKAHERIIQIVGIKLISLI